jgi:threonine dehydrogenase-like Zn-dependent dehydrogenase
MTLPVFRLPAGWLPAADTLADRVVLVTGAYGGLGGAVARAASRAGATVVITGKRKRQLEQLFDAMLAEGLSEPVIHPLDMEVATPREYTALAEGLERDFGRLDGVVHTAASFTGLTPIAMHKPDDWLRALHVNVSAPFALTQACMPLLTKASDSSVVLVYRKRRWSDSWRSCMRKPTLVRCVHTRCCRRPCVRRYGGRPTSVRTSCCGRRRTPPLLPSSIC